ncbi:Amine oxidase [Colletotrichum spinosum]|uniref:Amine oxidase n=1 Tax=Colletotrichum spinosum TaxID=1347390 RepID=A0A4V3HSQ8_9PEZI|nr:Amine oxidase [Colletotrichum spinosum]
MAPTIRTLDLGNTSNAYYAPATVTSSGKLVHVSGQPGSTADGRVPEDYESQIHLALLNLRKIIIAAGASVKDIAKLTLYIVDYDSSARKHARHIQRFLGGHRPAITLVPVPKLAVPTWLFEIDAVVAVPEVPRAPLTFSKAQESVDVVIIGAGLAGLTAARDVMKSGLSCILLEARDRVGGKTWSQPLQDGQPGVVDLGAAWINDTNQSKMYALAQEFGAELIEQNTTGNVAFQGFDGKCSSFEYGDLPKFDQNTRQQLAGIRDMVEADCQNIDTWKPSDASLDSLTFEAYLRSRGAGGAALATANVWTRAMLGQDATDISALFFLNYCKSGGGLLQMRSDRKGGGQHLRVRQGTQFFSQKLASLLPGGVVRLGQPVHTIRSTGPSGVEVQTSTGVLAARKVISTVPGPVLNNINFDPPLPPAKRAWVQSLTYGYYTKAMMEFKAPFWVDRGFCGLAQSFVGPASVVRDTSIPADGKFVLTCFMASDTGRAWSQLDARGRETALLEQLGQLFGHEEIAGDFVRLATYEWTKDEWSGWGCPCASLTPGVLDTFGGDSFRQPCGNLHFAGTETAAR